MRYYFDTEFHERPCTIELISIGIVAQDDRSYYAVANDFDLALAEKHPFLAREVLPKLIPMEGRKPRAQIAKEILEFIGKDTPEFWAYFADYDWVVFCWLFGSMVDLPAGWPKYCRDLKQLMDQRGITRGQIPATVLAMPGYDHHALADALWVKWAHQCITERGRDLLRKIITDTET